MADASSIVHSQQEPEAGDPLGVRDACSWVLTRARDVRLGTLDRALAAIEDVPVPDWDEGSRLSGDAERTAIYLLVLDTVNFSFWREPDDRGPHLGYRELARSLRAALERSDELSTPEGLAALDERRLAELVGPLPMLAERVRSLRELGRHGFEGLVQPTAVGTARALSTRLRSYADVATYDRRTIPLLKRAQILPADLHGAGVRRFPDLAALTCFADYKLPQILRHWGVLQLTAPLAARIDSCTPLRPGEPAEVEIRAATITAVEHLRRVLAARGRTLCSIEVDWILWEAAQSLPGMRPHPRVRTIYY